MHIIMEKVHKFVHLKTNMPTFIRISVCLSLILCPFLNATAENGGIDDILRDSLSPKNINLNSKEFDPKFKSTIELISKLIKDYKDDSPAPCNNQIVNNLTSIASNAPRGLLDEVYYLKGLNFEICQNLKEAQSLYEKSLQLRRNNPNAIYRMLSLLIAQKKFPEANILIQEAKWNGFKDEFLLSFYSGVIQLSQNKYTEALTLFTASLKSNPNFLPAAKGIYQSRFRLRGTLKNKKAIEAIDLQLPIDLAQLNRLDEKNYSTALPYMRYLLSSGDPIKNPAKLNEGLNLTNSWLPRAGGKTMEVALLKIQFLEKLNNKDEALIFLTELEKSQKLSPGLQAKKDLLAQPTAQNTQVESVE